MSLQELEIFAMELPILRLSTLRILFSYRELLQQEAQDLVVSEMAIRSKKQKNVG